MATIVGTPGNDDIIGTARADVIVGGRGTDSIYGRAGDDIICGGRSGLRVEEGEKVPQLLSGGPGDDVIVGGPGHDVLSDTNGVDLLLGRGGGDSMSVHDRGAQLDDDVLRGGAGPDQFYSIRGADSLYGGKGDDFFQGGLGDNSVFRGGAGDDRFDSGRGNDTIYGGPGSDVGAYINVRGRISGSSHCNDVTADLSSGVVSAAGFGVDTLNGVENLASGGGNDVLVGNSANNTFYVGSAAGACYDERAPREAVAGGGGWDRISFDSNHFELSSAFGPVVVDLALGTAEQRSLSPFIDAVVGIKLDSIENVTGTEYADTIMGDDGPNRLSDRPSTFSDGGDVIRGRGGDDRLTGSVGPDDLYGDEGADKLVGLEGNDRLDGGTGTNAIDGGKGLDTCQNPDRYNGARNCEA
ncbi:calcium-binding protein [Nocardioides sp. GCM10028917]|uniref:calcium-binding protein n=1 Tax=Nocardioides sp. GCM10028917 TaxID=3273408 RepID=UPI0036078E5B